MRDSYEKKFLLCICFIIITCFNSNQILYASDRIIRLPHYYVTQLQELEEYYINNHEIDLVNSIRAFLFDMNNDGNLEMLTFCPYYMLDNSYMCYDFNIYSYSDKKSNKSSIIISSGYNVSNENFEDIYISNKKFIISNQYELGNRMEILSYKNETIKQEPNLWEFYSPEQLDIPSPYVYGGQNWIDKQKFEELYDYYGVNNPVKWIMRKDTVQPTDDTESILKMYSLESISPINVIFDFKEIEFELPIISFHDINFYPVRELVEMMGGEVLWNEENQSIIVTKGDSTIRLSIGNNTYTINGKMEYMDENICPFIENNRIYIPICYLAEAFGYEILWDSLSNTIEIK